MLCGIRFNATQARSGPSKWVSKGFNDLSFIRFILSNTTKTSKSPNESISNNYCISIIWIAYIGLFLNTWSGVTELKCDPAYRLFEMFPLYNSIVAFPETSGPNLIILLLQIYCHCFNISLTSGLVRLTSG